MRLSASPDMTDVRACSLAHRRDLRRYGAMPLKFRSCLSVAILAQAVSFSGLFGNKIIFSRSPPTADPPPSIQAFSLFVSRVCFVIVARNYHWVEKIPRQ